MFTAKAKAYKSKVHKCRNPKRKVYKCTKAKGTNAKCTNAQCKMDNVYKYTKAKCTSAEIQSAQCIQIHKRAQIQSAEMQCSWDPGRARGIKRPHCCTSRNQCIVIAVIIISLIIINTYGPFWTFGPAKNASKYPIATLGKATKC